MAFTGKATYSAGTTLPELMEDVSDLVGIISPYETTLLDCLGNPMREAISTHHEWLEDELLPNKDSINDPVISYPESDTSFNVANADRFRIGDQIQTEGSKELMIVTGISAATLTVIRGYAGTSTEDIEDGDVINILGNASLEGSDKPNARFTARTRKGNYCQIFTATVEVSGSDLAASQFSIEDEMDYQKQERLRELIRDLENTVINGGQPAVDPQGSVSVRRTMKGIIQHITSNVYHTGDGGMPSGISLTEEMLNYILRNIWQNSSGNIDTIVVNGFQKRKINSFADGIRTFSASDEIYKDAISVYQSDFGICKIITSRWIPQDTVLMIDSSRINVLPLAGRSFHFKPLSSSGDYECGELIGEYTLEFKNEAAHGILRGLATS